MYTLGLFVSVFAGICYIWYMICRGRKKMPKFLGTAFLDIWPTLISFVVILGMFVSTLPATPFTVNLVNVNVDVYAVAVDDNLYTSSRNTIWRDNVPLYVVETHITAMTVFETTLYILTNQTILILSKDGNMSFEVDFFPTAIAVDEKIYLTGYKNNTPINYIYILDRGNVSKLQTFNNGDTFTLARGLMVHDHLLYVTDYNRVLVFRGLVLIREIAPIYNPISLTFWNSLFVIAQETQTQIFKNEENILTLDIPSRMVVAGKFLFILGEGMRIYS